MKIGNYFRAQINDDYSNQKILSYNNLNNKNSNDSNNNIKNLSNYYNTSNFNEDINLKKKLS